MYAIVLISNTGAHGGLLERLALTRLVSVSERGAVVDFARDSRASRHVGDGGQCRGAMEAGDVESRVLVGTYGGSPRENAEEYARRLRDLRAVRVKIQWTYSREPVRAAGAATDPPAKWCRCELWASFDGDNLRREIAAYWRQEERHDALADIVQAHIDA